MIYINFKSNLNIMILYILIGIIILDSIFSLYRVYKRINLYNKAHEKSKSTNKELLVIGNPDSGFINKNIYKCYDCGDICLDLNGCGDCPNQIIGDLLEEIKKLESNKYVIFESCVLEYIDDIYLSEIKKELNRVTGDDLYQVRNSPNILPLHYKFIELG